MADLTSLTTHELIVRACSLLGQYAMWQLQADSHDVEPWLDVLEPILAELRVRGLASTDTLRETICS